MSDVCLEENDNDAAKLRRGLSFGIPICLGFWAVIGLVVWWTF